ncbi:2-oxoglutarate dehydrogenase E1 component [Pajaroellobacter abortibovis]|uniref:2-oxoglutarate dehydrogenase E1 component n=1 Tax=Pajaroellobacter abortibovis TaxID=1882918 RepID=A0A1L6MWW5_9BACT|nr:2-oxoglutarate dehydrogenase E1 component [Pajaroellobacter abortibovis]APR99925.1 2-oxoglutarate dehydrogenase E1 component [Pajaroellobacter abortibovis]
MCKQAPSKTFYEFGINAGYVEELYTEYLYRPKSVSDNWHTFFETMEGNVTCLDSTLQDMLTYTTPSRERTLAAIELSEVAVQARMYKLVNTYRTRGHLFAHLDPLKENIQAASELHLSHFGLTENDLEKVFPTVGVAGLPSSAPLQTIIDHLQITYCRSIGVEFTHIENPKAQQWLQEKMESTQNRAALNRSELLYILKKLTDAEILEQFLYKNYVGAKRFSLEGAESMIALIDLLVETASTYGVQEIVIGMAHRGRLNVLINILGKNPRELFAAFDDKHPERFLGSGDVKYHLGYSSDRVTKNGALVHLSLAFNPSHLEWVNPVVEGRVRAKQDREKQKVVMPLLIHGDASFIGQGIVMETLNLSKLPGYSTGGTVHLVVNNQIGFTTNPEDARSTRYCTDITHMLGIPVFHVNGEDPEAVIQVTKLAIAFRQQFATDVVIDMYCYRKHGHNEGDEPRYTQPLMYARIDQKPTVREMYVQHLTTLGEVTQNEADTIIQECTKILDQALEEARKGDYNQKPSTMQGLWTPYKGGSDKKTPEGTTAIPKKTLLHLLDQLSIIPSSFKAHPKVVRLIEQRKERALADQPLDWGAGEHLAFASLLVEKIPIRLTGQDVQRGTFSHRHAVLLDMESGESYIPLNHLSPGQASLQIYNSPLSEAGVLGFEYGYSLDYPDGLVLWEAQFGDFWNSAQVIVDQFIASAEDKWRRLSGLVLLLPHGYEGAGPEHSSARIERFLQLASNDNIQICTPTTPAQFFHLLRRQVHRPLRKPLVVFTPKSLLRHPDATSRLKEFTEGGFQRILGDPTVEFSKAKTILLTSGKVYYDLLKTREEKKQYDTAILRLEQLYPISPFLLRCLQQYKKGIPVVWVQEEPLNMGGWYFMNARQEEWLGNDFPLSVVARPESASPATGSKASHDLEQKVLLDQAFKSKK